MNAKNIFLILISCLFLIFLGGMVLGAEDNAEGNLSILSAFAVEFSDIADSNPQTYWILLIFLSAVAIYVYYVWNDYEKDDDFLVKK